MPELWPCLGGKLVDWIRNVHPLHIESETSVTRFMIAGLEARDKRTIRRIIPRNCFESELDVRDLLPDVVVPLGDIWPQTRNQLRANDVRTICPSRWCVYVVRSSEDVLYVGMTSSGLQRRISQHVYGRTTLGETIRHGSPESLDFITEQYLMPDKHTAMKYEIEMMRYRSPLFNIAQNTASRCS